MQQDRMMGDDWKSGGEVAAEKKAVAQRKKTALDLAKKLESAADLLNDFVRVCRACNDGSGDELRGISDSRQVLIRDLAEYAGSLNSRYGK